MNLFKPTMYQKNVFCIPFDKFKKMGIQCLVFDLDNTLALISNFKCPDETKKLIRCLKKDFSIFIISNNNKIRLEPYLKELGVVGFHYSLKPSIKSLIQIRRKYHFQKEQMVLIGDQMVTDILAGNRFGIQTVLVDPLGEKDLKITKFNRFLESKIISRYQKKGIFERGKYYE